MQQQQSSPCRQSSFPNCHHPALISLFFAILSVLNRVTQLYVLSLYDTTGHFGIMQVCGFKIKCLATYILLYMCRFYRTYADCSAKCISLVFPGVWHKLWLKAKSKFALDLSKDIDHSQYYNKPPRFQWVICQLSVQQAVAQVYTSESSMCCPSSPSRPGISYPAGLTRFPSLPSRYCRSSGKQRLGPEAAGLCPAAAGAPGFLELTYE